MLLGQHKNFCLLCSSFIMSFSKLNSNSSRPLDCVDALRPLDSEEMKTKKQKNNTSVTSNFPEPMNNVRVIHSSYALQERMRNARKTPPLEKNINNETEKQKNINNEIEKQKNINNKIERQKNKNKKEKQKNNKKI